MYRKESVPRCPILALFITVKRSVYDRETALILGIVGGKVRCLNVWITGGSKPCSTSKHDRMMTATGTRGDREVVQPLIALSEVHELAGSCMKK